MAVERLQKVLAAAGVASRRECEEMILEGRVSVNGTVVCQMPVLVDAERDKITVDGQTLRTERKVYFLLNKPRGVHSTNYDPEGRRRAIDLLKGVRERVFPVGCLDAESTGLLLLTNDGELAERLTHPRHGVPKTYRAHVKGLVTAEAVQRLRKGVWLSDGKAHVADAKLVYAARDGSVIQVTLCEGKNREVRRVLAKLGYPVRKLMRTHIGPLSLKDLPAGEFRALTPAEVESLRKYKPGSRPPSDSSRSGRTPRRPPASGSAGAPTNKRRADAEQDRSTSSQPHPVHDRLLLRRSREVKGKRRRPH